MGNVTDISKLMPHTAITGKKRIHVIPMKVFNDIVSRKISITDVEDWEDFFPEIISLFVKHISRGE